MEFKEAINQFCTAISSKNLSKLKEFIPVSGDLTAILSDGAVIDSSQEYLEFHKEWFAEKDWTITFDPVFTEESSEMGYAIIETEYFDKEEDGSPFAIEILKTVIMRKQENGWSIVHSQQTEGEED